MTVRKKDLTAICNALHDGFLAAELTVREMEEAALIGATREVEKEYKEKNQQKRLHIYHDCARDVGRVLEAHNKTFDLERFIKSCLPKKGELP